MADAGRPGPNGCRDKRGRKRDWDVLFRILSVATLLSNVCERFNWVIHTYCQMSNHYHLLLETVDGNL